jgi:hypothetical protein
MKIAQISPLMESVPPRLYGGTERIVSYLTDELVRLGHEVTLFASADSITAAETRSPHRSATVRATIFVRAHGHGLRRGLPFAARAAIHIGARDGRAAAATAFGKRVEWKWASWRSRTPRSPNC